MKRLINEFRMRNETVKSQNEYLKSQNEFIKAQNAELEWANIYRDTIKDRVWLKSLAISPGRWAGNYSFFYILVRVLTDCKPQKIIEFGLGESSKVVSSFLENELLNSNHLIIEQDANWIKAFKERFNLSNNSQVLHLPLQLKTINGFEVNSYADIGNKVNNIFDLYIIDGPHGSDRFSRYDICLIAEKLKANDEFIIIIDDYCRQGEKDTGKDLIEHFYTKGAKIYTGIFSGKKSQFVIVTEKYRFLISI